MTKPIGFSAFLKLLELAENRRRSELKKKLGGGGGFQYWRPIQTVAPKAIKTGASIELLTAELESLCSGHQKKYNKAAFAAFNKWRKGKSIQPAASLPMIEAEFGNSGLVIRMRPEVTLELDGIIYSMSLWATTKPILSIQTLSVGLFFLAAAYKKQGFQTHQHAILDTVGNRFFSEANVLPTAIHMLKDKVDAFKKTWEELNPKPTQPLAPPIDDRRTVIK
jgi:hypothetical protein